MGYPSAAQGFAAKCFDPSADKFDDLKPGGPLRVTERVFRVDAARPCAAVTLVRFEE